MKDEHAHAVREYIMHLSDDGVRHTMQNMQFNLTPTESVSLATFERMLYNMIEHSVYHALSSSSRLLYKSELNPE